MLKIAVVGNNYKEVKDFIKYKFEGKIAKVNTTTGVHTLTNGDEIHLCYGDERKDHYLGVIYDAFTVTPEYTNLLETIRYRTTRHR